MQKPRKSCISAAKQSYRSKLHESCLYSFRSKLRFYCLISKPESIKFLDEDRKTESTEIKKIEFDIIEHLSTTTVRQVTRNRCSETKIQAEHKTIKFQCLSHSLDFTYTDYDEFRGKPSKEFRFVFLVCGCMHVCVWLV